MALFKRGAREELPETLPTHIGIIMDGNGRWAKWRGLPRQEGHRIGARVFKETARYCNRIGIRYLTVYAFSTENWQRPPEEVEGIMNLLREYLADVETYREENIHTRFIGDREALPPDIVGMMDRVEQESAPFTGMTLNIAINYGGRLEIVKAVRRIADEALAGSVAPNDIDPAMISAYLDTAGIPDPDLIIRPSGEMRLSNFLIWQSAYAEFVSMDVLWPDFKPQHLNRALQEFARRSRRFGCV